MKLLFYWAFLFCIQCKPVGTETATHQIQVQHLMDVEPEEAKKMIASDPALLILDVRTPQEISAGKIENPIELNFKSEDFEKGLENLDRSATYLVYCQSGKRSAKAGQLMIQKGFLKVYSLVGGYNRWKEQ